MATSRKSVEQPTETMTKQARTYGQATNTATSSPGRGEREDGSGSGTVKPA